MPETPSTTRGTDLAIRAAGWALFVFSLFPYLSIVPIATDTQPYAVIFAVLIFLMGRGVALPLPIWTLFVVLVVAIIVYLATGATFNGLRSLVGYASVFLISAGVLILASHRIRLSDRMLDVAVYIWFVVGAVQRFASPDFLAFILARSTTTESRGVTSLAVEPSAYATMMLFILMIYFIRGRERSWPAILCLVQILLLAQSALGILFVLLAVGLYMLLRLSAPAAMIALLVLAGISFFLFVNAENIFSGTRVGGLLIVLTTRPELLFVLDESVAARVSNIFYSVNGAFEDWLVPHGFDGWTVYVQQQEQIYRDIFIKRGLSGDRIMSGYGAILFELGALGLAVPVVMTLGILRTFGMRARDYAIAMFIMIHGLMIMPVPLALPMVGVLLGELFVSQPPYAPLRQIRRMATPLQTQRS